MTTLVAVVIMSPRWSAALPEAEEIAAAAVAAAAGELDDPGGAPAVVAFADDDVVRTLNREHLGVDAPTNVLAFPALESPEPLLGDIVLAFDTIEREARDARIPLHDHVSHLIVHGFLHLQGYDHQTDDEADLMESLERRALAQLGIRDPYGARADA
ncbi:MAG: rRNA maturation RNase YbeY [Caulobacterales bacterium]|nr:rRNA maturation RNase YbeY [Caulobacterales bacterium]